MFLSNSFTLYFQSEVNLIPEMNPSIKSIDKGLIIQKGDFQSGKLVVFDCKQATLSLYLFNFIIVKYVLTNFDFFNEIITLNYIFTFKIKN